MGFMWVPMTTATLSGISRAKMANASGVYTLVRQLGGSLGIAILQLIQIRRQDTAYAALASGVTSANPNVNNLLQNSANPSQQLVGLWQHVMLNAEAIAYNQTFELCAIVFLCSLPMVFMLRPTTGAGAEGPPVVAD